MLLEQKLIIDQYAELTQKIAHDMDRLKKLKEQVDAMAKADPSLEPIALEGLCYAVDYSAPSKTMTPTVTAQAFIKKTKAWGALKIGVTEAKKLLTEEQFAELFTEVPGSRRFLRVRKT